MTSYLEIYMCVYKKVSGPSRSDPDVICNDLMTPCSPCNPEAIEINWMEIDGNKLIEPVLDKVSVTYTSFTEKRKC